MKIAMVNKKKKTPKCWLFQEEMLCSHIFIIIHSKKKT